MSQRADYRNMLFLVGFFVLGLTLTGFTFALDSKLNGSDGKVNNITNKIELSCRDNTILWCNRILLVLSLLITGTTLMSIIYNAKGIDSSISIKDTGKLYGSYSIILIVLGLIVLIVSSIMLARHISLNSDDAPSPGTNINNTEQCAGQAEMIGIIITSFVFMGLGIGMTVISWNLVTNKTNTSGVYRGSVYKKGKKSSSGAQLCKKGMYLEEHELRKNVDKKMGVTLNYKGGDCEERFPCFDPKRLRCYKMDGQEDSSWKEEKDWYQDKDGNWKSKSINRIVARRRKKCNEKADYRWDNEEPDYTKACKSDDEYKGINTGNKDQDTKRQLENKWRDGKKHE